MALLWLVPLASRLVFFFFINIIAMIYHCADFIVSHTYIYIHAYTLRIRLVKRAGPLTSSAYVCLGRFFLFYGRLFDIFINILSMCFTKSAEIRTMCPAAIAFAEVAYRRTPSSMYRVSTVSKLASFCPSVYLPCCSCIFSCPA